MKIQKTSKKRSDLRNVLNVLFFCIVTMAFAGCVPKLTDDEAIDEEQAFLDLQQQLDEVKAALNNGEDVAASFTIGYENGQFSVEDVDYLDEFEYGLAQGLSDDDSKFKRSFSSGTGTIKVSCDKNGDITECPEQGGLGGDLKQAKCVGEAIKSCLDDGGCAEVCSAEAIIEK